LAEAAFEEIVRKSYYLGDLQPSLGSPLDYIQMKTLLRHGAVGALFLAAVISLAPIRSVAQEVPSNRRLLDRSAPSYPDLARNLALAGTVKVEALVSPDGSVKSVSVKGGHPVLAQAAANAVRRWRWEPAVRESHETVEVRFSRE
jgi:TonB family protein